jgi:hypothetical protein
MQGWRLAVIALQAPRAASAVRPWNWARKVLLAAPSTAPSASATNLEKRERTSISCSLARLLDLNAPTCTAHSPLAFFGAGLAPFTGA